MGCVYIATNLINGKQYVGMTTKTIDYRIGCHIRSAMTNPKGLFHKAISEFGDNNFKWEVAFTSNDRDELVKTEIELIKRLGTFGNGYNMNDGGGGGNSKGHLSDEHKAKISLARKGKKLGPMSEEHKRKISETRKGKPHPHKGSPRK